MDSATSIVRACGQRGATCMNTSRDVQANHLYFAGLSIDPVRTFHLKILNSPDDPFRYKVSKTVNDQEESADQQGQYILDRALQQYPECFQRPVYIPERRIADYGSRPLLTVQFPDRGCEFVLDESMGITRWYIQPLLDMNYSVSDEKLLYHQNAPYKTHPFFTLELFPVQWPMLDLLKKLYRSAYCNSHYHFPRCNKFVTNPRHRHYVVSILLATNRTAPEPETEDAEYTTINSLCEDTEVKDIFKLLAGDKLHDEFALTQLKWVESAGNYERHCTYSYKAVCAMGVRVRHWGWFGTGYKFWLLPLDLRSL